MGSCRQTAIRRDRAAIGPPRPTALSRQPVSSPSQCHARRDAVSRPSPAPTTHRFSLPLLSASSPHRHPRRRPRTHAFRGSKNARGNTPGTPPAHGARGLAHENPRPQPHRARPVHRWPPPARKSLPPRAPRPRQNQAKPTPGATDVHAPSDTQTPPPRQPETGPSATPRGRQPPNRRSGQRALRPRRFGAAPALAIQLNVRGMSAAIRSNKPRTSASVCPSFAAALRTCAAETGSRGSSPG